MMNTIDEEKTMLQMAAEAPLPLTPVNSYNEEMEEMEEMEDKSDDEGDEGDEDEFDDQLPECFKEFNRVVKSLDGKDLEEFKMFVKNYMPENDVQNIRDEFENSFGDLPDNDEFKIRVMILLSNIGIDIYKKNKIEEITDSFDDVKFEKGSEEPVVDDSIVYI